MWVAACWSKEILIARAPAVSSGASINFIVPDVITSPRPDVGFFTRLPSQIGKDVVALHSEDHYLRVFTKLGEALILARLSDAIELCAASGISGTRIHRSWWVSNQSVIKSISLGRKVSLILHGDIEAPVSQSYKAAARQSGLLTDQHNK